MNRPKIFFDEICDKQILNKEYWELWSADFNKRLKNAIVCEDDNITKRRLRYVFSYWQTQNRIRNLNSFLDISEITNLRKDAMFFAKEVANEGE